MDRTIEMFKDGAITHTVFDLENSISLLPWEGGEIIMSSISNDEEKVGYSIPMVVNNKNWHVDKDGNSLLEYSWNDIDFDVTESQKAKLMVKTGELVSTVPIVGHNIKYDMKWLIWHQIAKLIDIRVMECTLNIAFQIFNNQLGVGDSLQSLCEIHLG